MVQRLAGTLLLAVALAGCGAGDETASVAPSQTGHVHAVGVDPADGSTYVAAHTGLYRATDGAPRATRVADDRRDVMGFTVEAPGRLAGSGHPGPGGEGPSSVGFIRSADGGRTWQPVALEGEADFHALEVARGRIYGFDALTGALRTSRDGGRSWSSTPAPPTLDLAVDPGDPQVVVLSTAEGLVRSDDGGRTLRRLGDLPASHLVWTARDGLVAVGFDTVVRRVDGGRVTDVGRVARQPAAASAHDGELLVAFDDGSVEASQDGGASWRPRLAAAEG
jgi:hypothetical protein